MLVPFSPQLQLRAWVTHQPDPVWRVQDTGMSDPTVNPGQAAETRSVHGVVRRLQDRGYVIQDAKGREVNLLVDGETT